MFGKITKENDERRLLGLAYQCEGMMKSCQMKSNDYAQCMVLLSQKLGFGITPEALKKASAKYIEVSE